MNKTTKRTSLGFKIVFAITIVFFLLFALMVLIFGLSASKVNDADLKGGLGDVLKYHFSDVKGLFSFKFHNASNIIYFSLSGLLYFFIFISVLYLIVGIILMVKKKRLVIISGIVASLLVILVFIMMGTGLPKYWYIINQRAPFDNDSSLIGPTFGILLSGALYVLAAYILYFYSVFITIKTPIEKALNEEQKEENKDEEIIEQHEENNEPQEDNDSDSEASNNNNDEPVLFEEVNIEEDQPEPTKKEEKVATEDIQSLLRELVRDVIRDEIARNNANQPKPSQENANNYGGPLIVQYFNTLPTNAPQSAPAPQPAPKEEVKEEKPQPEVRPEPVKQEVVVPAPVKENEKKPIIRIPFVERMLSADKEMQKNYNELKNEIMSYGVNSRVSNSGDTFRLHRVTYIKITIAGLSLKLYFALNPDDYKDSTLPVQNAGHKGIYKEIPLVFKVKSGLSMRRCKQLIQDVFDKNGFEQGEIGDIDWVEDLKNASDLDDDD